MERLPGLAPRLRRHEFPCSAIRLEADTNVTIAAIRLPALFLLACIFAGFASEVIRAQESQQVVFHVLHIEESAVYIDIGRNLGLQEGTKLSLFHAESAAGSSGAGPSSTAKTHSRIESANRGGLVCRLRDFEFSRGGANRRHRFHDLRAQIAAARRRRPHPSKRSSDFVGLLGRRSAGRQCAAAQRRAVCFTAVWARRSAESAWTMTERRSKAASGPAKPASKSARI